MKKESNTLRLHLSGQFVQIPNSTVRDKNLSFRATGLLAYMLSMADGWVFSVNRLGLAKKDGKDSAAAGARELETAGYLFRERDRDGESGRLKGVTWHVADHPAFLSGGSEDSPQQANPDTGIPHLDFPAPVSPPLRKPYKQEHHHSENNELKTTTTDEPTANHGGGGGGEDIDLLVEAAFWDQCRSAAPRNVAGWRSKVRRRMVEQGISGDDLDTLKRWQKFLKKQATSAAAEAARRDQESRKPPVTHGSAEAHAKIAICSSILKPKAAYAPEASIFKGKNHGIQA